MRPFVFVSLAEMPIHVGIDETEDDGFVANQGLVVTFRVRNVAFVCTAVGEFPENGGRFPVFVLQFLDGLDPIVRNVHGHAVVEPVSPVFKRGSEAGHATNLLCDGDGLGIELVNHLIGQRKVADGIVVLVAVEIISVAIERFTEAVAVIEHGSDSIKPETIEMVLL